MCGPKNVFFCLLWEVAGSSMFLTTDSTWCSLYLPNDYLVCCTWILFLLRLLSSFRGHEQISSWGTWLFSWSKMLGCSLFLIKFTTHILVLIRRPSWTCSEQLTLFQSKVQKSPLLHCFRKSQQQAGSWFAKTTASCVDQYSNSCLSQYQSTLFITPQI